MVVSSFALGVLGRTIWYMGFADSVSDLPVVLLRWTLVESNCKRKILTILFFNILAILPVCFFSTFGPAFGLRQMVLSRFAFGWWGVKLSMYLFNPHAPQCSHYIVAFCNCIACIGWSSVNVIVGAQLIYTVNNNVPGFAGILIIAFATVCYNHHGLNDFGTSLRRLKLFITVFGYKVVHLYEFYSWIPSFLIFLIVLGQFAHSGEYSLSRTMKMALC